MKKNKEVSTELTAEQLAILNEGFPMNDESNRLILPRFGLLSKDITETTGTGKLKKIEVIQSSGTFYTEEDKGNVNEEGKKIWTKTFLDGDKQDVVILFYRKQLSMYDSSLEKFYSTPIFDNSEQIIPLYLDKKVLHKGTQKQLQEKFPSTTLKGKLSSNLKEVTILYVLVDGVLHQCNLSQSSKWEFLSYKKNINPSSVITTLSSTEETFGENTYRKMTFTKKRNINGGEFDEVIENQRLLKDQVEADKRFFVPEISSGEQKADDDFAALPGVKE